MIQAIIFIVTENSSVHNKMYTVSFTSGKTSQKYLELEHSRMEWSMYNTIIHPKLSLIFN